MASTSEQKKLVKDVCRAFWSDQSVPIAQKQQKTSREVPPKGDFWISKTTFAAPSSTSLRDALFKVISRLSADYHPLSAVAHTPLTGVSVEFIGARKSIAEEALGPEAGEEQKLSALEADCEEDFTVLFLHSGAFYFHSPAASRGTTTRLARLTKARVACIKYRLAPVHQFPAALLDTLVAYTSLLYPPPEAAYSAVPANRIVLAGSSSGANLCLALTKFLLELRKSLQLPSTRDENKISFHGREDISIPLPLGIANTGGWFDLSESLPSWHGNGEYDIVGVTIPPCMPDQPVDAVWPSDPPREHPYCVAAALDHELVSPAAVSDWMGIPPMWFGCGSEDRCIDSNRVLASQAAECRGLVYWNEYEGMPHEFASILGRLPQSEHMMKLWAGACLNFAAGRPGPSTAVKWMMPDCKRSDLGDPRDLSPLPFEQVKRRMRSYSEAKLIWTGKYGECKL